MVSCSIVCVSCPLWLYLVTLPVFISYIYMYLLTSKSAVDEDHYKQDGIPVEYAKVGALLSYVNVVIL